MLDLSRVTITSGADRIVRSFTLSLHQGERVGIVGESGCGKSVTALAMMGMLPPALRLSGSIRLDGVELCGAREAQWRQVRARKAAMIFQEPLSALNPLKTVETLVSEPLRVHEHLSASKARARVLDLLNEVRIPDPEARLRQYPHQLSGGQRQRVMIAMALACRPQLLIADEPTTALDASVAHSVLELLQRLSDARRMALIFISHDLAAVAKVTDRLVVMYAGDIVETGLTEEIISAPRHPYTQGLISARPRFDPGRIGRKRLPSIPGVVPRLAELATGCRFSGRCPVEMTACAAHKPELAAEENGRRVACTADARALASVAFTGERPDGAV